MPRPGCASTSTLCTPFASLQTYVCTWHYAPVLELVSLSLLHTVRAGAKKDSRRLEDCAGAAARGPGSGPPCPRIARGGAGPGRRCWLLLASCRAPTNPQGLVSAGPAIASEGLQVGILIATHRGLVRGFLVLVQSPQV